MGVAGLGDRAQPASLAGGVLARGQAEEATEALRSEACPVAELDSCGSGTRTATSSPSRSRRASRSASRRSVLTSSPDARGILDGAATVHDIPSATHTRASPYPVGPASYATRTGRGNRPSHSTMSAGTVGAPHAPKLARPRIEHARDDLARMHIQPGPRTLNHTGASRNYRSTAAPLATATRANLRARRRITLHTVYVLWLEVRPRDEEIWSGARRTWTET